VLVGIFGVTEEGKKLLGSHGPQPSLSYWCAIVFLKGNERDADFSDGQFNGPSGHFDRSAVILA